MLRIYNSDKCQLVSTTCKLKDFKIDNQGKINFCFEHMYVPVETSATGSSGIYNLILPLGFKFVELHIVDPFDIKKESFEEKKHFVYQVYYDNKNNYKWYKWT